MDQPDHTRLRRIVSRDFTPVAVRRWRPMVESYVSAALDRISTRIALPKAIARGPTVVRSPARKADYGWARTVALGDGCPE